MRSFLQQNENQSENQSEKHSHFSSLNLKSELLSVLAEVGFSSMTPIQSQSLPLLLSGKDLIGKSKTGSGKTAAFVLPILEKLQLEVRDPQALIICPTRELGQQVTKEIRRLGRKLDGMQVLLLAGGQPVREQAFSLSKGIHIAVGTPGRILDLIYKGKFFLNQISTLVLDEADKMLELGFEADIRAIINEVPQMRQTVFFSATFPDSIEKLSQNYQKNPMKISIEDQDEDLSLIDQIYYEYADANTDNNESKLNILYRVLQQHLSAATLIFCNQKVVVDELVSSLKEKGASCAALHGNLEQADRDKVMALFRNGSYRILVATDLAARGLDIDHLELVINYDFPLQPETYIHRIGRTGRAGKKGTAVTLIRPNEEKDILDYVERLKVKINRPSLGYKNQHGLPSSLCLAAMQTLSISGGRKNKLRPGDILGALTGVEGNIPGNKIGKIEIQDYISYVAIATELALIAEDRLKEGRIKGQKFFIKLIKT